MNVEMVKELIKTRQLRFHHRAAGRGYVSRKKPEGVVVLYRGRFGRGIAILKPRWDTTRYILVEYYIAQDAETYDILAAWEVLARS